MATLNPINTATDTPSSAADKTNANELAINAEVEVNNAKVSYPTADSDKVALISVTQSVDLDTMESDIATNNAKVSNATHTGDVTGSTALTVEATAISGKTSVGSLAGTEEVLVNESGTLKKTTTQDIADLGGGGGGSALSLYILAGGTTVSASSVFGITESYDGIGITNTSGVLTLPAGTFLIELTNHAWDLVTNLTAIRINSTEIDRYEVSSDASDPSSACVNYSFVQTEASSFTLDLYNPSSNPATYESDNTSNTTQGVIVKITKLA
jgi:hypothetical protein